MTTEEAAIQREPREDELNVLVVLETATSHVANWVTQLKDQFIAANAKSCGMVAAGHPWEQSQRGDLNELAKETEDSPFYNQPDQLEPGEMLEDPSGRVHPLWRPIETRLKADADEVSASYSAYIQSAVNNLGWGRRSPAFLEAAGVRNSPVEQLPPPPWETPTLLEVMDDQVDLDLGPTIDNVPVVVADPDTAEMSVVLLTWDHPEGVMKVAYYDGGNLEQIPDHHIRNVDVSEAVPLSYTEYVYDELADQLEWAKLDVVQWFSENVEGDWIRATPENVRELSTRRSYNRP